MCLWLSFIQFREKERRRREKVFAFLPLPLCLRQGNQLSFTLILRPMDIEEHKGPFRRGWLWGSESQAVAKGWTFLLEHLVFFPLCLFLPTVVKSHTKFYCFYLRGSTVRTNGHFSCLPHSMHLQSVRHQLTFRGIHFKLSLLVCVSLYTSCLRPKWQEWETEREEVAHATHSASPPTQKNSRKAEKCPTITI